MNHDREERRLDHGALDQQHHYPREPVSPAISPLPSSPSASQESALMSPYERATRDKYPHLVSQTEHHPEMKASFHDGASNFADDLDRSHAQWRPSYLKRRVLGGFVFIFVLIIAAIEGLLAGSKRAQGLGNPQENQHYLWTYGPTGFLTIVAASFARIGFQAKLLAPWLRLVRGPQHPDKAILVDYLSAFQIVALYKSLRNKDFMVSAAVALSFLIKVMIVISTGLITLSYTTVTLDSYPMTIQDNFVNSRAGLIQGDQMAYFLMTGLLGNNLTYPNGISRDYAFQSVAADIPEIKFTVDGLTNGLDCKPASATILGSRPSDPRISSSTLNLTMTSDGCNMKLLRVRHGPSTSMSYNATSSSGAFMRFEKVQCDESKEEAGRRILLMYGNITYTKNPNKNMTTYQGFPTPFLDAALVRSTQLLCVPTYAIERVDVTRNGTRTDNIVRSERFIGSSLSRTLSNVTAWTIMDAHLDSFDTTASATAQTWGSSAKAGNTSVDSDEMSKFALNNQAMVNPSQDLDPNQLYDSQFLQSIATAYYRQYGAIVAKLNMVEPAKATDATAIEGTGTIYENRLIVRDWAAHVMTGIAVVCLALTIYLLLAVPVGSTLPQHPGTLHGLAALLMHSPDLLARLRGAGAGDEPALREALQGTAFQASLLHNSATGRPQFALIDGNKRDGDSDTESIQSRAKPHHPYVFHPATRIALGVGLIGLIIALELILRKSNAEKGLGDAGVGNIHYGWTAAPTIIFGSLAMLFSVMDFEARSLAPYHMLRKGVFGTDVFMKLDLLDMSVPRALYHEIGLGQVAAFATTTTFLVASFFTVFSGSLFQALDLETQRPATLYMNTTFKNDIYESTATGQVGSLILNGNLSWPDYTYQDLAFPQVFQTNASRAMEIAMGTDDSINVIIPALRSALTCRMYTRDQITTNHTRGVKGFTTMDPLGISIAGEIGCKNITRDGRKYSTFLSAGTNITYFGLEDGKNNTDSNNACSELLWIWGHLDHNMPGGPPVNQSSSSFPVAHVAAMGCNQTIEAVDTNVTFQESERGLVIKTDKPPRVVAGTARPQTKIEISLALLYSRLVANKVESRSFDATFSSLTRSRWAVPIESLESAAGDAVVGEALKQQHGIVLAQFLHNTQVVDGNKDAAPWPPGPDGAIDVKGSHEDGNRTTFSATATDAKGRRRIVQDAASTRVLQALLGVALVLGSVLAWAFMRDAAVLAREATSVGGVAALVAGGNLLGTLPPDAEWRTADGLKSALSGGGDGKRTKFWLGWGQVAGEDGEAAVRQSGTFETRFGIFVERTGERGSVEYKGIAAAGTKGPYQAVSGGSI